MPEPSVLIVPLSHRTLQLTDLFEHHSRTCLKCGSADQDTCELGTILLTLITDLIIQYDYVDALAKREL